jgi:hypothetical protein
MLMSDEPTTNPYKTIRPYHDSLLQAWVFDDPETGLVKEGLVDGTDLIIERATADFPDPRAGFRADFSDRPFAEEHLHLQRREPNELSGGYYYYSPEFGLRGWLCPALFLYFPNGAPEEIFVRVSPGR